MNRPASEICPGKRQGSTLVVDCSRCRRGQSIADRGCLHGVLENLRAHPQVERILLSHDCEVLYSDGCVDILASLADALDFCRSRFSPAPFDDCQLCPSNPQDLFNRIAEDMIEYRIRSDRRESLRPGNHGQACERCVSSTGSDLNHLDTLLRSAERSINRDVFHIVTEEDIDQDCC